VHIPILNLPGAPYISIHTECNPFVSWLCSGFEIFFLQKFQNSFMKVYGIPAISQMLCYFTLFMLFEVSKWGVETDSTVSCARVCDPSADVNETDRLNEAVERNQNLTLYVAPSRMSCRKQTEKRLKILKLCMCVTDNTGWQTNRKANETKSDWPFPKIQGLRHRHLCEDIDCCCCCPRHRTKLPLLMQQGF